MSRSRPRELNKREGKVLLAIVELHREYGDDVDFAREAVEYVTGGPCPGSLAGLAMLGYVSQRNGETGLVYKITESGTVAAGMLLRGRRPKRVNGHQR